MQHPFARRVSDHEIAIRYPGAEAPNPYALYGPDALASLARRILLSEANPNDRALFVPEPEVARVVALNPGQDLPAPVVRRLSQIAASGVRRPKGRIRSHQGLLQDLWRRLEADRARDFYHRSQQRLRALKRAGRFEAWRRARGFSDECNTPATAAAELTRRRFFSALSRGRVMNRLFSRK